MKDDVEKKEPQEGVGEIRYLGVKDEWVQVARRFLSKIENDGISHGVIAYREKEDGSVNWFVFGKEHITYMIGMLERVKHHMHDVNFGDNLHED